MTNHRTSWFLDKTLFLSLIQPNFLVVVTSSLSNVLTTLYFFKNKTCYSINHNYNYKSTKEIERNNYANNFVHTEQLNTRLSSDGSNP